MIPEARIVQTKWKGEKYITGYFLTIKQLAQLVRDFQADCHDGFVSNDEAYLESKLKEIEYDD